MITPSGPKVLEYNVRFGDPETQALMLLLSDDTDLAEVMMACVERRLDSVKLAYIDGFAVSVVLASEGYPGKYPKGLPMSINPQIPDGQSYGPPITLSADQQQASRCFTQARPSRTARG